MNILTRSLDTELNFSSLKNVDSIKISFSSFQNPFNWISQLATWNFCLNIHSLLTLHCPKRHIHHLVDSPWSTRERHNTESGYLWSIQEFKTWKKYTWNFTHNRLRRVNFITLLGKLYALSGSSRFKRDNDHSCIMHETHFLQGDHTEINSVFHSVQNYVITFFYWIHKTGPKLFFDAVRTLTVIKSDWSIFCPDMVRSLYAFFSFSHISFLMNI